MGGNLFHCPKDWLYTGDSACLGTPAWSGTPEGGDGGLTTAERQRLKELERENRELRCSNDILRRFAYFCEGGVRPPLEKVGMPLLDKLRKAVRVGPVCSELHIAPSTYYHCQQQRHHPDKRSARAQRDDWLKKEILRVYDGNHQVYGVRKVWRQLLREGIRGSQMYSGAPHGGYGTCRCSPGKKVRTTVSRSRCRRRPRKPSVCGRTS